jgi:hypothetical protein
MPSRLPVIYGVETDVPYRGSVGDNSLYPGRFRIRAKRGQRGLDRMYGRRYCNAPRFSPSSSTTFLKLSST